MSDDLTASPRAGWSEISRTRLHYGAREGREVPGSGADRGRRRAGLRVAPSRFRRYRSLRELLFQSRPGGLQERPVGIGVRTHEVHAEDSSLVIQGESRPWPGSNVDLEKGDAGRPTFQRLDPPQPQRFREVAGKYGGFSA